MKFVCLEELVNDLLNVTNADESNVSRRPSRLSTATGSNADEVKSVKFASSLTKSSSQNKTNSTPGTGLSGGPTEEINTISTIRILLQ
jgi:hypothetical protein